MTAGERRMFRALGGVDTGSAVPPGEAAEALRAEFERAFALKASLRDEAEAPISPTGRRTTADAEAKLRTLVASVEGASRFAIRLGLLDPGQVRAIWSEAIGRGLYEGWDGGSRPTRSGLAARRGHRAFPGPKPRRSGRPKTPSSRRPRGAEKGQASAAAGTLGRSRRRLTSASLVQR
jgi:hypothetical protein